MNKKSSGIKFWVFVFSILYSTFYILPLQAQEYGSIAAMINAGEQAATIQYLSSLPSRMTGLDDAQRALTFIEGKFREIGLRNIEIMEFPVVVPVDKGATLQITGRGAKYELHSLWPNLVNPSAPEVLEGPIIYAGKSTLEEYNGKEIKDAIVLIDFNCSGDWFNAFLLGAKAVIFIEPIEILRGETEKKYLSIPLNAPRFWISRSQANSILNLLSAGRIVIGELKSKVEWEKRRGLNIWGFIPGRDAKLKKELVVIESFYDAISVVPSLAPGAEDASGISALIQVAKTLTAYPPKRSVMILASSGHFEGLQGMKYFIKYWNEKTLEEEKKKKPVGVNLALKKPAKCSSREPAITFVAKGAFDGKMSTRWSSAQQKKDDEWIMVDLEKPEKISQVVLYWEAAYCASYAIQTSVDGTTWDTAFFTEKGEGGEVAITFPQREARYIKMQSYRRASGFRGCSLWEIEVYKEPAPVIKEVKYPKIALFISLDLSSRAYGVGLFYKGSFYDQREDDLKPKYSPMGMKCNAYADSITAALGLPKDFFANGINPIRGRSWKTYLPTNLAFNGEVIALSARTAITFATINDARPLVDTPLNTIGRMNLYNLFRQTQFIACIIHKMLNDPEMPTNLPLPWYNCLLRGKVVEFDPRVSYIPNTPVPHSLVVARGRAKVFTGVRGEFIDIASSDTATFEFRGLASIRASWTPPDNKQKVEAYRIDSSGNIIYAPDLGEQGAKAYPIAVPMDWGEKEVTVVVFPCVSASMFDLIDQRFYKTFKEISVFDGRTNCEPTLYGYSFPVQMGAFFQEPAAMVYTKPNEILKVTMGSSLAGVQFTLLNSNETEPLGAGYRLLSTQNISLTPYKVVKDMWILNDWRMRILKRRGIENNRLDELHNLALRDLTKADSALLEKDYENFVRFSHTAWGFESRGYPDVRKTGDDVVKGVLFYLFLLLPFAHFLERLLFAFPDIRKQIVGTFAIFLIIFAALRYVHPAFDITLTPFMVLLAFITLALAILVIGIILGKFDELFKEFKKKMTGVHTTDVGRISATATAFSLGVSNMRKRKGRTGLTCGTLILLTFTVLSFTSVRTFMRATKLGLNKPAMYEGMLFRDRNWEPMEETTYKTIATEFAKETIVSPRCWYYSTMVGNQSFIDVKSQEKTYTVTSIAGMSPQEINLTPDYKSALTGRWFEEGDIYTCILPESVAKGLQAWEGSEIRVFGLPFRVIGILDEEKFKKIIDLDEEEVTPVNYLAMSEIQMQVQPGAESTEAPPQKFIHLMPHEVIIIPYSTLMNLGGELRSVAVGCKDTKQVRSILDDLMPRLSINLFVGEGGKTYYSSSIGRTSFSGLQNLFIPIAIAAFIILNTMLGSVYERVKEIGIYSAVGLAPSHVAALFLAEACVYATVGSVSGYLLGQGISKVITMYNLLPGLTLNYSSVSATGTIGIIILMVILSSIYPARKASELAVPAIERKWKLTEPMGDEWFFELPFTVTGSEARGVNAFLKEFFDGHAEYSIGHFYTEGSSLEPAQYEHGPGFKLSQMVWLAPFDLGVSQETILNTEPLQETPGVYRIRLHLLRKSGDIISWKRTNTRFVNHLRKQLLLWRTLTPDKRSDYIKTADEIMKK